MPTTEMVRIGVLSDTHGTVPEQVFSFFKDCDELWHAGDIGRGVLERLRAFKPVRAVYGNMDDYSMRYDVPETALFVCGGLKVLMTHIGGWPGHYQQNILKIIEQDRPDIFVCGHSHVLKVMYDQEHRLLHITPEPRDGRGSTRWARWCGLPLTGCPRIWKYWISPSLATLNDVAEACGGCGRGKVILWVWSGGGQQWERQRPEGTRQ